MSSINVLAYPTRNTHRLRFGDHVKLFADGGFFAELLMLIASRTPRTVVTEYMDMHPLTGSNRSPESSGTPT